MFWQFNYQSSEIENLLNKEDITLLDLLNEDDILQECKAQNIKLIEFLSKDENINELIRLVVGVPDMNLDLKQRYKLPVRACEILTSNVSSLNDGIFKLIRIQDFLTYLNTEDELNPLQASLFAKLFQHLATFAPQQLIDAMCSCKGLDNLLRFVSTSAIMDSILHIATLDSFSQWLLDNNFISKLVQIFSPQHSNEEQENICNIMVELIRRWRDVSPPPNTSISHQLATYIQQKSNNLLLLDLMLSNSQESSLAAGLNFYIQILNNERNDENVLSVDGILDAFSARWDQFNQLLKHPPTQKYCPMLTTWGSLRIPLGRVRLFLVQFVALITAQHNNIDFNQQLLEHKTLQIILDLYFKYVWNNFLHLQVLLCIQALINQNDLETLQQLISDYKLLEKIVKIFKENNAGLKVAHLGHLTNISNLLQQYIQEHKPDVAVVEDWNSFVEEDLTTINHLNNTQLVSGWDNIENNELNFESEVSSSKEFAIKRLFGLVDGEITGSNEIVCGVVDVFEALCNQRNNQTTDNKNMFKQSNNNDVEDDIEDGDMFSKKATNMTDDDSDMFTANTHNDLFSIDDTSDEVNLFDVTRPTNLLNNSEQVSDKPEDDLMNEFQHGVLNFNDQQQQQQQQLEEGWANFENMGNATSPDDDIKSKPLQQINSQLLLQTRQHDLTSEQISCKVNNNQLQLDQKLEGTNDDENWAKFDDDNIMNELKCDGTSVDSC